MEICNLWHYPSLSSQWMGISVSEWSISTKTYWSQATSALAEDITDLISFQIESSWIGNPTILDTQVASIRYINRTFRL